MSSRSDDLSRPALADLTNHTRKRTFDGYIGKISDGRENGENLQGPKQVCFTLENLGMEKNHENYSTEKRLSNFQTNGFRKDLVVQVAAVDQFNVKAGIVSGSDDGNRVIELDVLSRDFCCPIPLIPVGSDSYIGDSSSGEILMASVHSGSKSDSSRERSLHGDGKTGDKDVTVANFDLHQTESSESAKFVKPRGVRSFELERCTSLKGDSNSNSTSAADMLKTYSCSCSFCLKAVKKSKKEAVNLFQRICIDKEANSHSQGNFDRSSKLESDLSSQWTSLFLHMEEAFSRESNHLQDNFLALKDLRENCKVNLEMINAKPADHA